MPERPTVHVYGPAYLDRVILVDRPLHGPGAAPLDQSVDGALTFGPGLVFQDPGAPALTVEPPPGWPGPFGRIAFADPLTAVAGSWPLAAGGIAWHDDLGGMGAGFAAAFGGELVSALGTETDPISRDVADLLRRAGVRHRPIRVPDRPADWTLLLTSGASGDKLAVGFRGCHAAVRSLAGGVGAAERADLRVVASFPNRLAAEALHLPGANVRVFAPALRNMTDRETSVARFADAIDVLCCNRREWESLDDRDAVAWQVSVLVVTDGPRGSLVRFTTPEGEPGRLEVPAFPRSRPPRDTNRAGEAFAATFVGTLLQGGWSPGVSDPALVLRAAERASAAAALVIDMPRFGFPAPDAVDAALRAGCVAETTDGGDAGPR